VSTSHLVGLVLGIVIAIWTIAGLVVQNIYRVETLRDSRQLLADMKDELHIGPNQLVVIWADTLPLAKVVTPLGNTDAFRKMRGVSLSGLWPTPYTRRRLAEFDIADLYRAIAQRPDVFFVANPKLMLLFGRYLRTHYSIEPGLREWVFSRGESQLFVYGSSRHHEVNRPD
jgi:hypothetical protein